MKIKDSRDVFFEVKIVDVCNKYGGGFADYWFPKLETDEAFPKRGYFKVYEKYNWIIGTGNYIDKFYVIANTEKEKFSNKSRKKLYS